METTEKLREALLDLEESRKREQQQRKMSETLLAGLHAILLATDPDGILRKLLDVLREPLDFEAAFVLRENSDGTLTATASSDTSFADTVWRPQAMFERVFAGQPVAVYDTEIVDEWRSLPDPVKQRARSALHFSIHASEPRALFVCTHSEPAHFSQQHVTLARRFSVLAMQALQKVERDFEITDLKRAQERIKHLNLVLRAVRNVNQLITKEKDRDRLLQGVCDILIEDRGYANAWIALLDEKQRATATAESGLGASFEPMAERLRRGELTHCAKAAFDLGEAVVEDPVTECADCPLASGYSGRTGVSVRLEHEGVVYGLISVSMLPEFAGDAEERSLFRETAGDIAFALHGMEIDEGHMKAETELLVKNEVFEASLAANSTSDKEGVLTYVNSAFVRIFGCENKEEAVGKPISAFLEFEDEGMNIIAALNTTGVWEGEYTGLKRDGITFAAHGLATIIKDRSGDIVGYQSAVLDITERKRSEEALRESESLLRQVINTSPNCVYVKDRKGRFLLVNQRMADMHRTTPEALVGLTDLFLAEEWLTSDTEIEEFRAAELEVIDKQQMRFIPEEEFTFRDGTKRWFQTTKSPIILKNKQDYLMSVAVDITERKKAEDAIRESNIRLQVLYDSSSDAIMLLDEKGFFDCNDATLQLFGCASRKEFYTRHPADFSPPTQLDGADSMSYARNNIAVALKEGSKRFEHLHRRLDGTDFPAEVLLDAMVLGGKKVLQARVYDITERKRAEEERKKLEAQLRQQQKLESIGTLASGVAHEINNPINGIMNYAQLISDRLEEASPLKEYSGEIIKESERVSVIVRNLLAFARDEKQTHSPAEITDIVESTLSLMRTVIRRDQITLEVHVPDDLPKIKCRSQRIQQVLMNLLSNARDALNEKYPEYHEDKILKVTVQELDKDGRRWLRTTVEDHGIGIPEEIRGRLMDPFFTTKPREKGTGLGLSISHGIVADHGGELTFESKLGVFTRFHLDLPINNGWSLDRETLSDH